MFLLLLMLGLLLQFSSTSITAPNIAAPPSPALERVYGRVNGAFGTYFAGVLWPTCGRFKQVRGRTKVLFIHCASLPLRCPERGDLVPHKHQGYCCRSICLEQMAGYLTVPVLLRMQLQQFFAQLFDDVLPFTGKSCI